MARALPVGCHMTVLARTAPLSSLTGKRVLRPMSVRPTPKSLGKCKDFEKIPIVLTIKMNNYQLHPAFMFNM